MVVSTFIDYYDEFLDKEVVYERLRSDKLELSDLNAYRYTLIVGVTCMDFIYRDGKIIMGNELVKYGTPFGRNMVKVKCEMPEYLTHSLCRIIPYKDLSELNKRKNSLLIILQNMDKELNFIKLPIYLEDSKIWLNVNLKSYNLEKILNGNLIASYLK